MSRKLEGSAGPKSQNGKMNLNGYLNSMLSLNSTLVLHAESWGVSISSPRLIHALSRNGMDYEILIDSFEIHGYPHNFSLFVEI